MACGIHMENSITWHAEKAACQIIHRSRLCAAEQADTRPDSGQRPAARTLHMRARGMAFCKRIRNGMMKNTHMTRMRLSDCRGSPASLSEDCRNRQSSESEAESPGACNDGSKWMNANNKACKKHGACHKSCLCTCSMPFNTTTDSSSGVSKDTLFPRKTRSARPQSTCQGHRITLHQWCITRSAATAVPKCSQISACQGSARITERKESKITGQ